MSGCSSHTSTTSRTVGTSFPNAILFTVPFASFKDTFGTLIITIITFIIPYAFTSEPVLFMDLYTRNPAMPTIRR